MEDVNDFPRLSFELVPSLIIWSNYAE